MNEILETVDTKTDIIIPEELQQILEEGFVIVNDYILLKHEYIKNSHIKSEQYKFLDEYESMINHLHLDMYFEPPYIDCSVYFLNILLEKLISVEYSKTIMLILSINLTTNQPTIRFISIREDTGSLYGDLEKFERDAMMRIDIINNN